MTAPRTPPAFIPTLTRELQAGEAVALQAAPLLIDVPLLEEEVLPPEALQPGLGAQAWAGKTTEATEAAARATQAPAAAPPETRAASEPSGVDGVRQLSEQMHARLLQRVDVIVQRRVREAAAAIALEHAQNLLHDLRPALEKAISEAVNEALALELASRPKQGA